MSKFQFTLSLDRANLIKGLAISAVVFVHVLAYLPGIYTLSAYQLVFITLDQLMRFCVPAFIILSGYGLAIKYQKQPIVWRTFFQFRLAKLLPLYLLWSMISILLVRLVPVWSVPAASPQSLFLMLLLGQADYQLYFLPVILQLYMIFPFLWFLKNKPNLLLALTLSLQIVAYLFFAREASLTDRFEYVLVFSWLGYFGFGIWLELRQALPKVLLSLVWPAGAVALATIVFLAKSAIDGGLDPLPALKFTRLPIIFLALAINLGLMTFNLSAKNPGLIPVARALKWLGKNSYLIFLAHTIGLRLIYAALTQQLELPLFFIVVSIWLAAIYVSSRIKL